MLLFLGRRAKRLALVSCLARASLSSPLPTGLSDSFYAREWGSMIAQGLELNQIFPVMQGQRSLSLSRDWTGFRTGIGSWQVFSDHIQTYPFFKRELALMIEYGKPNPSSVVSWRSMQTRPGGGFFHRLNKAMNVVQPLVFVFVALMIVLLYAAMLLPIYEKFGGSFMKSLRTLKVKAFTLIEMLVVLLIISVLLLLFVPNLTKQKDSVTDTGNRAVVKVVESQAELYELNHQNEKASLSKLVAEGQITQNKQKPHRAHYVKNAGDHRAVAD